MSERSDSRHQAAMHRWAGIVAAYDRSCAQSPITIKAWCLENGVSAGNFSHWRSILMREKPETSAGSSAPDGMVDITPFLTLTPETDTGIVAQSSKETPASFCRDTESSGRIDSPSIMIRLGDAQIFVGDNAKESTLLTLCWRQSGMLRDGVGFKKIYLCLEPVDMRRGIDSLAASLIYEYRLNIYENKGCLYLFRGKRSQIIKGICFEGIGVGLYKLRLSEGNRFQWPKTAAEAEALSPEQYQMLMSGIAFTGTITERYPKVTPTDSQAVS